MEFDADKINRLDLTKSPGKIRLKKEMRVTGNNGQESYRGQNTTIINCATVTGHGGATLTVAGLIPAGCILLGVTAFVVKALTGASLSTWKLGIGSHLDRFATGKAKAAGTAVDLADVNTTDTPSPVFYPTATDVLVTAAAGVFSTGQIRLTAHFDKLIAATS